MSDEHEDLMASWAFEFAQAVRQLSNHQTTTMKKREILPNYMTLRNVKVGEKVVLSLSDSSYAEQESGQDEEEIVGEEERDIYDDRDDSVFEEETCKQGTFLLRV